MTDRDSPAAERDGGAAPLRALAVFHGEGAGFWPRLFGRPGFRHCFVALNDGRAFKATRFPLRYAITNERRGLAAADMALAQVLRGEKGVVRNAMYRHGAGSITFYVGEVGNAAKKYRGGSGMAHIIAKHGPEVLPEVIETISKGTHTIVEREVGRKNGHQIW